LQGFVWANSVEQNGAEFGYWQHNLVLSFLPLVDLLMMTSLVPLWNLLKLSRRFQNAAQVTSSCEFSRRFEILIESTKRSIGSEVVTKHLLEGTRFPTTLLENSSDDIFVSLLELSRTIFNFNFKWAYWPFLTILGYQNLSARTFWNLIEFSRMFEICL
jgi:hypothetical protein